MEGSGAPPALIQQVLSIVARVGFKVRASHLRP